MTKPVSHEDENPEHERFYATVGQRIRELREGMKITQQDLATRAAVKRTYINEVERLGVNLSLKLVYQIARGLNVKVSELFPDDARHSSKEDVDLALARSIVFELFTQMKNLADQQSEVLKLLGGAAPLEASASNGEGPETRKRSHTSE